MFFQSLSVICRCCYIFVFVIVFFCKQNTAYDMRISYWSSDVCSSDLLLIDEYDAPLTAHLGPERRDVFEDLREGFVKRFFTQLKSVGEEILLCFVTGISAFEQTTIWSLGN